MHVYFSYKCIYILTSLYISNHNNACVEPKLLRIVFLKRGGGAAIFSWGGGGKADFRYLLLCHFFNFFLRCLI